MNNILSYLLYYLLILAVGFYDRNFKHGESKAKQKQASESTFATPHGVDVITQQDHIEATRRRSQNIRSFQD